MKKSYAFLSSPPRIIPYAPQSTSNIEYPNETFYFKMNLFFLTSRIFKIPALVTIHSISSLDLLYSVYQDNELI